jgi:hypothetical protein
MKDVSSFHHDFKNQFLIFISCLFEKNGCFQFALEEHESIFNKAVLQSMIGHRVEDKQLRAHCLEI